MAGGSVTGLPPYRTDELTTGVNICAILDYRFVVPFAPVLESDQIFTRRLGRQEAVDTPQEAPT